MIYKDRKLFLFLLVTFFVNLSFGIYYFYDQASKENAYVKSIWVTGENYIIPEGHEFLFGDSDGYNKFAYSFIEKGEFYNPIGQISAWVTPGYPLFLSSIYLIFGVAYLPVLIIQTLLLTLIYFFVFNTTFLISESRKASWIAVLLTFINIRITTFVQSVYTEILFLFVLILLLFLIIKSIIKKDMLSSPYFHFGVTGFLMGFAILIRPIVIPFLLVAFIFFIYKKIKIKHIIVSILMMSLLVSFWLIRNYYHFDRILISTNSEITMGSPYLDTKQFNFWNNYDLLEFSSLHSKRVIDTLELNEEMIKKNVHITPEIRENINQGYIYEHVSYLFAKSSNNWVLNHPDLYFIRTVYLVKTILSPFTLDLSSRNKIIAAIIWCFTILPAFLYLFFRNKNDFFYFLLISGLSLVILPAMTLVDSNLRYQVPLQLITTIISALFLGKVLALLEK